MHIQACLSSCDQLFGELTGFAACFDSLERGFGWSAERLSGDGLRFGEEFKQVKAVSLSEIEMGYPGLKRLADHESVLW